MGQSSIVVLESIIFYWISIQRKPLVERRERGTHGGDLIVDGLGGLENRVDHT